MAQAKRTKTVKRTTAGRMYQRISGNLPLIGFVLVFGLLGIYFLGRSLAATGNDLIVTSVTMSPASPAAGQPVSFTAIIKNQGSTATTAGKVVGAGFQLDGQRITWNESNTVSLAAGASLTVTANAGVAGANWTASTGPHTLVAVADDTNAIPDELDEGNNTKSLSFTIGNTGNLYLTPATSTILNGNTGDVTLRLTPGTTVDGVQATLTYDSTKLQYVSVDSNGSPFDVQLGSPAAGTGTLTLSRGNLSGGVSTDALIAKVTFKALAGSGTTSIQLTGNAAKNGVYTNPTTANTAINFTAPDTTPPITTITSPGASLNWIGTQTVTASASDASGVTKVELYIDGVLKGTDTTSTYSFSVDSTSLSNGTHALQTKAYDSAGNVGSSPTITITAKNLREDINLDGKVDLLDFSLLASKFGQSGSAVGRSDINGDGTVNLLDFSLLAAKFGQ